MHWRRKWQPTPVFLPGESRDVGAYWAAVYGVAQSWTRLKRLSSSNQLMVYNGGCVGAGGLRVRRGGGEEIPLVQGKEQWLRFAGAAVKKYPTLKVRETQVRP